MNANMGGEEVKVNANKQEQVFYSEEWQATSKTPQKCFVLGQSIKAFVSE
jgi:hypothetical protein